jgi:hypothetical protein
MKKAMVSGANNYENLNTESREKIHNGQEGSEYRNL